MKEERVIRERTSIFGKCNIEDNNNNDDDDDNNITHCHSLNIYCVFELPPPPPPKFFCTASPPSSFFVHPFAKIAYISIEIRYHMGALACARSGMLHVFVHIAFIYFSDLFLKVKENECVCVCVQTLKTAVRAEVMPAHHLNVFSTLYFTHFR